MALIEITHHHQHHFLASVEEAEQWLQHTVSKLLHTHLENMMAEIDQLQSDLSGTKTDLDTIKTGIGSMADQITALHAQLTALQQTVPPQVNLAPALAAADAVKVQADALVAALNPAPPVVQPPVTTPPVTTPPVTTPPVGDVEGSAADEAADTAAGEVEEPGDTTTPPVNTPPTSTPPTTGTSSPDKTPA